MGLKVKIEATGSPQRDFYQIRNDLIDSGKKFDAASLRFVHYKDLPLCVLSPAAEAMCPVNLVVSEKKQRRERFLIMPDEELKTLKNYLEIERMWDDIMQERAYRILPHWDDMNFRQRLWLTLTCIFNHVDDPHPRGGEAMVLLKMCNDAEMIPPDVTANMQAKLRDLLRLYPNKIESITFRDRINNIADAVLQFIPVEERKTVENEELRGYSCTSDCFRVLLP